MQIDKNTTTDDIINKKETHKEQYLTKQKTHTIEK